MVHNLTTTQLEDLEYAIDLELKNRVLDEQEEVS